MPPDAVTRRVIDGLEYPVIVAADAAAEIGTVVDGIGAAIVVADARVTARAHAVAGALRIAGVTVRSVIGVPAGEERKTMSAVEDLCERFISAQADRHTAIVAVGGGTLTDAAGFAAAITLRGLSWIAVPTTTLGMVDAAIGGKTGVDLRAGKNLAGAFWPPRAVIADVAALETLPARERAQGVAEALKAAIVGDSELFALLESFDAASPPPAWVGIIARAAAVKVAYVGADPFDRGRREALNLGHTFAHAIESATRFEVPHGDAVAIGLRAAGALAIRVGAGWSDAEQRRLDAALVRFGLPDAAPADAQALVDAMGVDKKRRHGRLRFVVPERIGRVRTGVDVADDVLALVVASICRVPEVR